MTASAGQIWIDPATGIYVFDGQQWSLTGRMENQFVTTTTLHVPPPAPPAEPLPPSEEEIAEAIESIKRALNDRLDP